MRLDPVVARKKFAREIERVQHQRDVLRGWGCWITSALFPHVDVVFVPRKAMHLTLATRAAIAPTAIVAPDPAPALVQIELGMLAARSFGVRLDLTDFDQRPPGVSFRDPFTWAPLPFAQLPLGQHVDQHGKALRVVLDVHPLTHGPFLCMRGTREYHEHPQHTGDDWALYRSDFGLFTVLSTIWRTCLENAQPNLVFLPTGGLQVQWQAQSRT